SQLAGQWRFPTPGPGLRTPRQEVRTPMSPLAGMHPSHYADKKRTPMLRVPISMANTGMKLALPVLHPSRGTMLLSEGFVLDALLIRRLAELEVRDIWVDYPDTAQIREYVSPAIMHQQSQMVGLVAEIFDASHHDAY